MRLNRMAAGSAPMRSVPTSRGRKSICSGLTGPAASSLSALSPPRSRTSSVRPLEFASSVLSAAGRLKTNENGRVERRILVRKPRPAVAAVALLARLAGWVDGDGRRGPAATVRLSSARPHALEPVRASLHALQLGLAVACRAWLAGVVQLPPPRATEGVLEP